MPVRFCLLMLATTCTITTVLSKASFYHDSTGSDFSLTCFTCVNVSDNEICNQYAIDRPCPAGKTFCHTLHAMGQLGDSWLVNKKCADRSECTQAAVGCSRSDGQTVCVSCCDEPYCNEPVPRNNSTAILRNTRNSARVKSATDASTLVLLCLSAMWARSQVT
ncbi:ly6/PLAUR domain-containing protein 6-like [Neocloeon triangulifer]|uniref:ly6/PLAUR domain-containing protein 6-like n=1 Tax=Neocloeon triangulifer TaxID=2078957 RepID=UPI00286F08D7|nr:ly6/PLAUR domain-containing protein 6-like [Neocloeon triangulifer]XP_059486454.1 ly6/PLAUR domain-containing protein 6-like [Neocloeon triangulifer]XP_059486456.1 ly6/PLAUR domain-containing protein 6-like [Neocloeon triangulifer]XP_059486457.1 ly6/PLAUR domain-containing protein 6-like [Neocloeon triangulifer]XP_059486458.1 ly6/PLAUR domain-containing protein 6-like [Neocloeon triangulifer]